MFGVSGPHRLTIEVQRCSKCPPEHNMDAGPDLCELGLFNLNNSHVFSRALLNDYTNSMKSLEAPFHSFCDVVNKRYSGAGSPLAFAGEDSFRTAWFLFMRIQHTCGYMHCDICGDKPDCIIIDGQSGGFAADRATSTLCPPTRIMPDSSQRIRYPAKSQHVVQDVAGEPGAFPGTLPGASHNLLLSRSLSPVYPKLSKSIKFTF